MPTTTGATNLGRVNLDVRSELFDVESFQVAGCPGVIGDFATYVVTFRGRLYVSFYCPEPVFQQERAIALVDDIVRRLRDACA